MARGSFTTTRCHWALAAPDDTLRQLLDARLGREWLSVAAGRARASMIRLTPQQQRSELEWMTTRSET